MAKLLLNANGKVLMKDDKVYKAPEGEDNVEKLLNNTLTSYRNEELETIEKDYAFSNCTNLESIDLPNLTKINKSYCFNNCTNLKNVNLPNLTKTGNYAFYKCTSLKSIDLPNLTEIGETSFGNSVLIEVSFPKATYHSYYPFINCKSLKTIRLPLLSTGTNGLCEGCTALELAYLDKVKTIYHNYFYNCSSLTDIYLGNEGVVNLNAISAFTGTTAGVKIHVRSAYADQYATATNWSSLIESNQVVIVGDYND